MRRCIRGMVASLLTMSSLSVLSLSAALPTHAQTLPVDGCSSVQVTMQNSQECVTVASLPQEFLGVTRICNWDLSEKSIIFVEDNTGVGTPISHGACKSFENLSGRLDPVN